jgi:Domain of unknown function (DUF3859)
MQGIALTIALCLGLAQPVLARPAPPWADLEIGQVSYGIFCISQVSHQESAPDTDLGFIDVLEGTPEIRFQQQEIPARLGVSFGVLVLAQTSHDAVRIEVWQPGDSMPESWLGSFAAGLEHYSGFTFDTEAELLLGLWRIEAWDGERRLYSVEFDVVPPSTLPGASSDCDLLS